MKLVEKLGEYMIFPENVLELCFCLQLLDFYLYYRGIGKYSMHKYVRL